MSRRAVTGPGAIRGILLVQFVPLILFPPESFSSRSQEWWLPILLAAMVVTAVVQLLTRRSSAVWPWHLMIFAQGFNIISRLMMVWAHATITVGGATVFNLPYVALTSLAMGSSAFLLWYFELPEVRLGLPQD
jgi:hypothetical protein